MNDIAGNDDELAKLQRWMQDALIFPALVDDQHVKKNLLETPKLSSADALGIYQRSYYARLLSCMREQFPALCYALGESVFNQFAIEYLREMPSDSYTLYELGRRLRSYLEDTRPDRELAASERELWIDFMVELAGFERLAFTLFDAPGDEGNLIEDPSISDQKLTLQQGVRLYSARFPVARFYCLVRDEKQPELPPLQNSYIALVRVNFNTHLEVLNYQQYRFLENLTQLNDIDRAINATCTQLLSINANEKNEMNIDINHYWSVKGGWREHWLNKGFFVLKH
ncbi:MAG: DNA-binding domain-containing protein [Arenicella sp.]